MVTEKQWQAAQAKERTYHTESFEQGRLHYADSYRQYFEYVGKPEGEKVIVEIGPADFPALAFMPHAEGSLIIEPMPSEHLARFGIPVITDKAEEAEYRAEEVWLFNVLQHVSDPHKIVGRAKKQADVIRFFEPINAGTDECHLWNLTKEMFTDWFGSFNYYPPNQPVSNFHTWECVYGVWHKHH